MIQSSGGGLHTALEGGRQLILYGQGAGRAGTAYNVSLGFLLSDLVTSPELQPHPSSGAVRAAPAGLLGRSSAVTPSESCAWLTDEVTSFSPSAYFGFQGFSPELCGTVCTTEKAPSSHSPWPPEPIS